ncbi:MAG: ribonuclease H-like domain-containing protein [Lachnospiraceae bacterium]|nr:ribonuclease H-like domain-containing protein [Lachnospiraceae bacterium]MDY4769633.1 ribonuclease H-like domain-containing protein [Lachnospiraceae bacterium]
MYINMLTFSHNIENFNNTLPDSCLYFDIETTGLQKKNALVYLIGCAFYQGDNVWKQQQWFADNPDEEQQLLEIFCQYASAFSGFCHFNGTRFDIPFLEFRCQQYGISSPFSSKYSRDLYTIYRPLKNFLNLSGTKQKDLETFLQITRKDTLSGKDTVKLYRDMIKYRDFSYRKPLLLHNQEDIQGLLQLEHLQAYTELLHGNFFLTDCACHSDLLAAHLKPVLPFPQPLHFLYREWDVHAVGDEITVTVDVSDGILKNYFENYKDYFYLPQEDTAIHKSLGNFLDKNLKKQASKDTCYTKFSPNSDFFQNHEQLETYFRHNLPILFTLQN